MKPFVMYGVASSIAMIVAFGSFIMGLARSQESDWLKGVKTTTAQNFIRMAQNYSNEFPVSGTDYPGDMSPAGKCGREVVLVQGANGKLTSSNYFDHDLPRDYRAKSVQELQTLILVKAVSQIVKLPSQTDQTGMRTRRYFYIIDKKTSQVIARKYIVLDSPEKVTRDENGKVVEEVRQRGGSSE